MSLPVLFVCIQIFILQTVFSQCVNRVIQGPNGPIELLPNQVLVPPGVSYLGPAPGQQTRSVCQPAQPIPPAPIPTEYNIPQIINYAPPNVISGNIIPNIPSAIPNILGNIQNIQAAIPNVLGNAPNIPSLIPNPGSGNMVVPNVQSGNYIVPNSVMTESYAPVVIHDNSVANSLANALQLLVVSSLLSSTLPEPYQPPAYLPGYGYVY